MDNQKLAQSIRELESAGKTKEDVYISLLSQGWLVDQIEKAYHSRSQDKSKDEIQKRTITIVLAAGAILIGAGVFSFIAANWQAMDKYLKIAVILAGMIAAHSAGWEIKHKRGYSKTGDALIFLGSIIFGAGVFLIGQIFNIHAGWHNGFILWMLGVLAMFLAEKSYYLLFLSLLLGFVGSVGTGIFVLGPGFSAMRASLFLFLIATAATYYTAIKLRSHTFSPGASDSQY
jgi:uncharacterized membrane protein